jgi:hypothetical protein
MKFAYLLRELLWLKVFRQSEKLHNYDAVIGFHCLNASNEGFEKALSRFDDLDQHASG